MSTQISQPEKLEFTWSDAFSNYSLVSSVLHSISRSPSYTDEEFEVKYNVMETMKSKGHTYGRGLQLATLGGLIYFCMKSNMIKTKVFTGFMYTYWISHFYTLGSHLGLFLYTKWACNKLNMGNNFQTGRMTQEMIKRLRIREQKKSHGEPIESEGDFLKEFYLIQASKEVRESYDQASYVANDYFKKNFHKYVKSDPNDNDPTKVFTPEVGNYEEQLKVPLIDCFLTRYIYHNMARWTKRFSAMIGLNQ